MRIPIATYRLQVNEQFTLHDAREIVPYLATLGVSDLYLSPVFEARSGSAHGYDVTDPTRIREGAGGEEALRALAREAAAHDMGIILDIVPNHMAASVENPWWRDVIRNGRDSEYAHVFDIDWGTDAAPRRLALPMLGDELDVLIDRGDITIDADAGEAVYFEHRLPLHGALPADVLEDLRRDDRRAAAVRTVLDAQRWELVHWTTASKSMSYRRFFDITDLVGVRVEDPAVFDITHDLVRVLAAEGVITGLRIDHVDGLRDPAAYLDMLRERVRGPDGGPVYTVVEKILERSERLPEEWQCEGTTGYEFLSIATGAIVVPAGHERLERFYDRITGDARTFEDLVHEKKLLVTGRLFGSEIASLARELAGITGLAETDARNAIEALTASMQVYRTYTRAADSGSAVIRADDRDRIEEARDAAVARFPDRAASIEAAADVALLEFDAPQEEQLGWVLRWQQFTGPVMAKGFEDTALYCHNALLAANDVGSDPQEPGLGNDRLHGLMAARFALQPHALNATATHDTKRGEDTRARIAVLSEVPDEWRRLLRRCIVTGDEMKAEVAESEETPLPGADVDSLLYQTLVGAWPIGGADETFRERIKAYMAKAVREAKEQTSWRRPDEDFEQALAAYIDRLMENFGREGLAEEVADFAARVAPHGAVNALTQTILRCTAPGIPDFYQGTELWSHTLVDPDNRAPVDFAVRTRLMAELADLCDTPDAAAVRSLLEKWQDGRIKMYVSAATLRFRRRLRDTFENAPVIPLPATGRRSSNLLAFARGTDEHAAIVVVPRHTVGLADGTTLCTGRVWKNTRIPLPARLRRNWYNALTGETFTASGAIPVDELFANVPFALLKTSQPIGA